MYSPVLKAAFESPHFVEGQTKTYKMDDTTEGTFQLFVQWHYTQSISRDVNVTNHVDMQDAMLSLLELWVLADKLLIPTLQNYVMFWINEHMVKCHDNGIKAGCFFIYTWENTAEGSPLRRYFLDVAAWREGLDKWMENSHIIFPNDFLRELVIYLFVALPTGFREEQIAKRDVKEFMVPETRGSLTLLI